MCAILWQFCLGIATGTLYVDNYINIVRRNITEYCRIVATETMHWQRVCNISAILQERCHSNIARQYCRIVPAILQCDLQQRNIPATFLQYCCNEVCCMGSWCSASLSTQPTVKILGVTLDPLWCFDQHVAVLCRSAFARLRFLYPSRRILSIHTKLSLYVCQSLVISLFDYADVVYGPCLTTHLSSIVQGIQNSCLRYSHNVRKFDHILPFFLRSGWLNVRQRWILHLCCIVHKALESETPIYLRELLCSNSSWHSVYAPSTRRGADLSVPAHRTVKFTASFSYLSCFYYNSLSLEIRSPSSIPAFKCAVRSFILVHYP